MVVLIIVSSDDRMLGSVQRWFQARRRIVFACQSGLLCADDIWGTLEANLQWCPSLFLLLFFLVLLLARPMSKLLFGPFGARVGQYFIGVGDFPRHELANSAFVV